MLGRITNNIANLKKEHPAFLVFATIILSLYFMQMMLKTEITPLGYFSLYSNEMKEQNAYYQILPYDTVKHQIVDIYSAKGAGFLMMEILPTRYEILANSDHCNQMNNKLRRLGLGDNNVSDCQNLKKFKSWMKVYGHRQGFDFEHIVLRNCGFKSAKLLEMNNINDSAIYK